MKYAKISFRDTYIVGCTAAEIPVIRTCAFGTVIILFHETLQTNMAVLEEDGIHDGFYVTRNNTPPVRLTEGFK